MNVKRLKIALIGLVLSFSNLVQAGIITEIDDLEILGIKYDVTFIGGTYLALWDADNNSIFTDDASTLNYTPTFWGNSAGAQAAAAAIMSTLGTTDGIDPSTDRFYVLHGIWANGNKRVWADGAASYTTDLHQETAVGTTSSVYYATFTQSNTVPEPSTALVFSLALMALAYRQIKNSS